MIKKLIKVLSKYRIWFVTMLIFNIVFGIFIWLVNEGSFIYIFPTMILGFALLYILIAFIVYNKEKIKKEAIMNFIDDVNSCEEGIDLNLFTKEEKEIIHLMGKKICEKDDLIRKQETNLREYEEYIETWAHNIKTPLALMTFVLDNRKEELPCRVHQKLEHARSKMQEDIERMLYYTRVKGEKLDYLFTKLSLDEICKDVIDEYKNLIEEEKIIINNEIGNIEVLSDKKGLSFILRQVLSNSIKYRDKKETRPFIKLFTTIDEEEENIKLTIKDNGIGVKSYDLPFLFHKGFTGNAGQQRKQSTGIGLYLVKEVAKDLNLKIQVSEECKDGFEISFLFPIVE